MTRGGANMSDVQGVNDPLGNVAGITGMAYPSNVLRIANRSEKIGHPAVFPPELPEFFMRANSRPGERWLDPFAGSGTVAISAEESGRVASMCERSPGYAGIILERMKSGGMEPRRVE